MSIYIRYFEGNDRIINLILGNSHFPKRYIFRKLKLVGARSADELYNAANLFL